MIDGVISTQQTTLSKILETQEKQDLKIGQIKESLTNEIYNQIRVVANYAFDYNKHQVILAVAQIKDDNNLDNRANVEKKLRQVLNNLYERRNSDFDAFTYNGRKLSYYTNPEWTERIFDYCMEAIYDGQPYHRHKYLGNLNNFYEELKIEFFGNLKKN